MESSRVFLHTKYISAIRELKNHDEVHDDNFCCLGKNWNPNVSFGGKKEKMQSVGRSTTTLNVNIDVKL